MLCQFCWNVGLSVCCKTSGCWNRPVDKPEEERPEEDQELANTMARELKARSVTAQPMAAETHEEKNDLICLRCHEKGMARCCFVGACWNRDPNLSDEDSVALYGILLLNDRLIEEHQKKKESDGQD